MFHLYTQLTAKINSKYIQKIYGINIEFADANKSLFFKGLIIYIYIYTFANIISNWFQYKIELSVNSTVICQTQLIYNKCRVSLFKYIY